jgi:hypothetical protein
VIVEIIAYMLYRDFFIIDFANFFKKEKNEPIPFLLNYVRKEGRDRPKQWPRRNTFILKEIRKEE